MGFFTTLLELFQAGGIWMWAILGVQIVSIAIIIERVIALYFVHTPEQKDLAIALESDIKRGQFDRVLQKVSRMKDEPIAPIAEAGTKAAIDLGGREEIQACMDEVLLEQNNRIDRRTSFLSMLANVATLLGLLGTIVGLIQAFSSVGVAEGAEKAALLGQGVSLAMTTTAYGLIAAIPALVMFAVLQNRSNKLSEDLNQAALRVFNYLNFSQDSVGSTRKSAK